MYIYIQYILNINFKIAYYFRNLSIKVQLLTIINNHFENRDSK